MQTSGALVCVASLKAAPVKLIRMNKRLITLQVISRLFRLFSPK